MTAKSQTAASVAKNRYFLALIPPPAIQVEATQLKHYFREHYRSQAALKSPPHITLQAPFEWPDAGRDRLLATLSNFQCTTATVPVTISGFGAFPPRVIYLAVEHTAALMQLQISLSQHLAHHLGIIDLRSRDLPFRPHLTVAFRDLKPAAFRKAWPEFAQRPANYAFTASNYTLLRHIGRQWICEQEFALQ
ncbi:MAG: 2'-5' RNA ligase family protein [Cyanobacteria bacterium P01_C01_bin.120]